MGRYFNVTGACNPKEHYMVDLRRRLETIGAMIRRGDYFTINRARQYGKTTMLEALEQHLKEEYMVVSLDFQMMSYASFQKESSFAAAFSRELLAAAEESRIPAQIREELRVFASGEPETDLGELFTSLSRWCAESDKPVVLMIDEVDSAANNQIFVDFLAQLRGYYIHRSKRATFQSVILAGVYDVKNLRQRLRPEEERKLNSPWNIAADFNINMSFSADEISRMLEDYEKDHYAGMNTEEMAAQIYDYTSGYPFLVSRICKLIDERVAAEGSPCPDKKAAWTKEGFLEALNLLLAEKNTLFESLVNKLTEYPKLRKVIYGLLFTGKRPLYHSLNRELEIGEMFGFIRNADGSAVISNRIFETYLYNLFLSEEGTDSILYDAGLQNKSCFIKEGHLDMKFILQRFVETFDNLYGNENEAFIEEVGRRYFLLFLKPIINGTGNYYVETETRDRRRTDIIVDYWGEQFIIELKIWHGSDYNERGEKQLSDYLDYYHLEKGYMLSFNFNKKKEIGIKEIPIGDKILIEAVV